MSVHKRFLASPAARWLVGTGIRLYRWAFFAGVRFHHDPALARLLRSSEPAVFACWHQDFLFTMGYLSRASWRRPTWVLASASRDGGLAAAAAAAAGFRGVVRGSSARGGATALRSLHRLPRSGSVAIVCDGPRPPARILKPGALQVARDSGRPLWLVRTAYRPAVRLRRTWAAFYLAPPWGRGVALADGPIHVPPGAARADLETLREEVEARLNHLAERADALLGLPSDRPPAPADRAGA